jgi:hypothetical protein
MTEIQSAKIKCQKPFGAAKLILHRLANRAAEKMKAVEIYSTGAMRNAEEYNFTGSEKAQYLVGPMFSAVIPMIRVEQPPRTNSQRSTNIEMMNLSFLNKNWTRLRAKNEVDDTEMRYKELNILCVSLQYPMGVAIETISLVLCTIADTSR